MKYAVLDCGQPAVLTSVVNDVWMNNVFDTQEDAMEYASKWLGDYEKSIPDGNDLSTPYDYSGYGDTIQIIELAF